MKVDGPKNKWSYGSEPFVDKQADIGNHLGSWIIVDGFGPDVARNDSKWTVFQKSIIARSKVKVSKWKVPKFESERS